MCCDHCSSRFEEVWDRLNELVDGVGEIEAKLAALGPGEQRQQEGGEDV